jgi:hypothetical protein
MAHGPIPDKPEEIDAELAKRLVLGLQVPDFMIDPDRHPGLKEAIAYADDRRSEQAAFATRVKRKQEEMAGVWEAAFRLSEDVPPTQ